MAATARFPPQTPMQQRPMNMGMSLQQSIRANNNIQHEGRSLRQAQSLPTRIEPAQRPNRISNPNPPMQQLRQSAPQVSDVATSSTSYRPPLNALGGPQSPSRRLNQPSKQKAPPETPQNHLSSIGRKNAPSCLAPPHVNRGSLNLNGFSDAVRPLKPPPKHSRTNNIFSNPAPVNKSTPDLVIDTDSDDELFGSPPDFNMDSASHPPAQETDLRPASASKRSLNGSRNQDNDPRAFKPPSKGKSIYLPEKTLSRGHVAMLNTNAGAGSNSRISQPLPNNRSSAAPLRTPQVAVVDSNPITSSGDESEKEREPLEPPVTTGKILLGNTAKRKRTKLLCQRPSPVALKERPTGTEERESVAKKPRKEPPSKVSSPPTVIDKVPDEDVTMVDFANDAPIQPPPAVKKSLSAFKFQPPTRVYQNKSDGKGKGIANDAQYRIEEKEEDTVEYQKEHDTGPWSSEALFLFDWRPPSMREKGK